eukprot:TRINITY_DN14652_c0_g1_i7.p1 TRINITY_DN14652_c0_g1~~TRINITY_DN14652_c0_g1_i7.p1  ORF type:complete len:320 (+),score=81.99 TRINITY_DN14652_c0_g1_i7:195-1154(+)
MCIRDRVSTQSTGISATSNMVWHVVKDSDEGTAHGLRYAVSYAQGDRNEMEDTHVMKPAVQPNGELLSYFAVFDGHGGKIVSDSCAKAMPELCNKHLKGEVTVDTIRKALRNGCFDMDHSLQPVRGRTMTCGSTGIMGYITNSHYVIANVGDSRCILVRRSGKMQRVVALSEDHKPNNAEEIARIGNAGGFVETTVRSFNGKQVSCSRVNGRLAVARAFGDFDLKQNRGLPASQQMVSCEPEVRVEEVAQGDVLIMACDGIWDVMNNQEVGEFVVDAMDALADDVKAACEVLVERAYALGSTDNMTAMIVSVGASCPPA